MKFSVVIPAYNRERELVKCLDSVLEQTYKEFEVIVVDNGSTDGTKELIENYIKLDKRVKYFWQENSGSPAGSRNAGIKNSSNEWIAFLDSDDYWYKTKLQEVATVLNNANKNIIAVSHYEDKEVNGVYTDTLEHGNDLLPMPYSQLLYNGNSLSTSAMTVRKDKLLELNMFDEREDYFAVEDYDLWMRLAKLGEFVYIKKALGVFCISDSNMSANVELINNNLKTLLFNHIDNLNNKNKNRLKKEHGARVEYYRGRTYQMNGEFKKATPILLHSIIEYPWAVKKYISLIFSLLAITK